MLVFTRTKHGADRLAQAGARRHRIGRHSRRTRAGNARTRALDDFKAGRVQVLVATDISGARHRHR
ncbi:MAG: hypothetical protein IPG43_22140, partial [Proteobacteria bacterium]|nr:hypothetical protein [Pseudomonadota bacterium]